MKIHLITLFISLLLVACQGQSERAASELSPQEQAAISSKTDAIIQQYLDLDIFSGIVLIAQKGAPFYHKAFGMADREKQIANTTTTLFDIGSMNKTFTSIVIKQLIDEGQLTYDSKLTAFIPGFTAPDADQITVEHLLNHESGFGDYHDRDYFESPKEDRLLWKIVERAKQMPLFFPPGEEQEYSNTGYVLLGAIIEKASGKSYFDNVAERIVQPLGLKNTYLQNLEQYKDRIAYGYYYTPLGNLVKNETLQDEPNPDGGFLSTTEDVMKFYRSYYYDRPVAQRQHQAQRSLLPAAGPASSGQSANDGRWV
jgi:CubicO group peptidase (beta-lactamase class C family)